MISIQAFSLSLTLVFLAEIGDKSQLVCMALAARHRAWPVLLGSVAAFSVLNLLAVLFGAALAEWIPASWLAVGVALLFLWFGIQSLRNGSEEDEECIQRPTHHLILSTFMMIFAAEFGDKTQLAVAGLAAQQPLLSVWLGGTLALVFTSALGVFAGRRWLSKLPVNYLHKGSGVLFLLMAALSASSLVWSF
ncbi:TMEM165/GDT1 family protein [Corallincola luteus]|uniref:GDT1 family protein n=1 Tax=Corallincola luteus TaxID=1775177 RepID=A0ABY2AIV8_9GAMM|nr:TMEM165/GDT1 family protein [Corallincola luteus]TCI02670.1 TMEM165/GDT1 family protein [Corallincola luteus]